MLAFVTLRLIFFTRDNPKSGPSGVVDVEKIRNIKGPIVAILGSDDERVTPWAFQSLLPAAAKYKKRIEVHLYPNARHAFHRPNWEGHNTQAADDAWDKTMKFVSQFAR